MKRFSYIMTLVLMLTLFAGVLPATVSADTAPQVIRLSSTADGDTYTHTATLNGTAVPEYDYTWHVDPTTAHDEVKDSPAEYHTGAKPNGEAVYIAHDIYYYPLLDQDKFQKVTYDGETEWVYPYEAAGYENYLFSTLPVLKTGFPSQMMHTASEAYQNAVLHITQAGIYQLEGNWHGQIRVDLGDDAFDDPTQTVTLILNGVTIDCTVASGIVFGSVYECDNDWEDADEHSHIVDTTAAGARIVLADGTSNAVSGTNIFRILKTKYKDDDSTDAYPAQKKRLKMDGAVYSYQSLVIDGGSAGSGVLTITSGFEGLNSELHLTLNGGNVNIYSQDDGINVNEDDVSVLTVNDGTLHICAGLGAEGDGVDSNGYLVINGGTVIATASPGADAGLDSDCGSFVNGGTVVSLGATMDWAKSDATQNTNQAVVNLRFGSSQNSGDAIILTDTNDTVVFAYDPDKDEVTGSHQRSYSGAVLSCPALTVGSTYHLYIGGTVSGTETAGIYDTTKTITFTDATRQCYGGTTVGGLGGGRPNMGGMPEGMPEGFRPDMGEMPEGMPEGFRPDMGGMPEGMTPPNGDMPQGGERPNGFGQSATVTGATCTYENTFTLSETVNSFSSVVAYRHDLQEQDGGYICSVCHQTFADANGTTPIVESNDNPSPISLLLWIALSVVGGIGLTLGTIFLIRTVRRKRAAHID